MNDSEIIDAQLTASIGDGSGLFDRTIKNDEGKMRISIVPPQIIRDVSEVREYGLLKYKDPENWRRVQMVRYIDALFRHFLAFMEDPFSVDAESGIYHYKHAACNMAFICEQMAEALKEVNKND